MARYTYRVSIDKPDDMTHAEMEGYIEDAVNSMRGGMNPDEPIFQAKNLNVKVSRAPKTPAVLQPIAEPRKWGEAVVTPIPPEIT